jgi:hypothetical protein
MTPLLPPLTVATPFTKLIDVALPNAMLDPALFETVGAVTGIGDGSAPENVRLFVPAYVRSVFPFASFAVIRRF